MHAQADLNLLSTYALNAQFHTAGHIFYEKKVKKQNKTKNNKQQQKKNNNCSL